MNVVEVPEQFLNELENLSTIRQKILVQLFKLPHQPVRPTTMAALVNENRAEVIAAFDVLVADDWVAKSAKGYTLKEHPKSASAPSSYGVRRGGLEDRIKEGEEDRGSVRGEGTEGEQGKKEGPRTHPQSKEFVMAWCEAYATQFPRPYVVIWGRDMKAASFLLESTNRSVGDLITEIKQAWQRGTFWCRTANSISTFAYRYNDITRELDAGRNLFLNDPETPQKMRDWANGK